MLLLVRSTLITVTLLTTHFSFPNNLDLLLFLLDKMFDYELALTERCRRFIRTSRAPKDYIRAVEGRCPSEVHRINTTEG